MQDFLYDDEVIEIRKQHKHCKMKRYADRLKAMILLNDGFSFAEVARILILDDDTIRLWYNIFEDEGIAGLQRDLYRGGISKLSEDQLDCLEAHLDEYVSLTAIEICHWVKAEFDIDYSVSGMTDLLHRLGFSYKKPTIVPGRHPEPEKQLEFAAKITEITENKAEEDQIYFVDGCHPRHNPVAGYGWIRKGEDRSIPSNTGREHLNLNGAYNPEKHEAVVIESEWVNAQSTIEMIEEIQKKQPIGRIILFADNARYYKCEKIRIYLKENPRVTFIHLPPYSPNLNLIERLWKFFKKKVLCQKYYPTLEKMRKATLDFFDKLDSFKQELKTLMTLNFQIIH